VPHARRPRAILIGDDILAKIGGYVLGNLVVSVIAAVLTFGWLLSLGVPYPFLLSVLVALLDLVPVVGSTVAGIIVALVALTVSLPTCLLTIGFFVVYRFFDDYVLVPKLIGKAVEVPALVTVVAVLIGRRPARRRRRPRRHPRRRRPGAHRQGDLVPPPR
jgi:predicted PurR-regulated permease PerM